MPTEITIVGPKSDQGAFELLKSVKVAEEDRFVGMQEVVQVTLQLTPLIVPLVIAYLKRGEGRIAKIEKDTLTFKGYNLDEISKFLEDRAGSGDSRKTG